MGTAPQLGPKYSPLLPVSQKACHDGFTQVETTEDWFGPANVRGKSTRGWEMTVRSGGLLAHQSHTTRRTGSCYLDFFSTKVPPSDAFHYLKSLVKQLMKTSKKKHRIPLNTAMSCFHPVAIRSPEKPSPCCIISLGSENRPSLLFACALHPAYQSPSFCFWADSPLHRVAALTKTLMKQDCHQGPWWQESL